LQQEVMFMANNRMGIISALLIGSAIGATVALLFAPQEGRKTRRMIRRRAEDSLDQLSEAGKQISEIGGDIYDRCKEFAGEAARLVEKGTRAIAG
jgi:gas vesicle protein